MGTRARGELPGPLGMEHYGAARKAGKAIERGGSDIHIQVLSVADGVWCFRRPSYFACSYLVSIEDRVVAIDAGMDSDARDFLQGLKAIGISPSSVRAILLTHWHNDHAAGAAFLQCKFGTPVYYAAGDKPFFTRETASTGIRSWIGRHIPEEGVLVLLRGLLEEAVPNAVTATRLVADREVVEGVFRVLATPGHTAGHVAYIHEPKRILFCGDALAVVHNRVRLMAKPVTPDLPQARDSALRCLSEPVEIICPGHRAPLTTNVRQECDRLRTYLEAGGRWPLLG